MMWGRNKSHLVFTEAVPTKIQLMISQDHQEDKAYGGQFLPLSRTIRAPFYRNNNSKRKWGACTPNHGQTNQILISLDRTYRNFNISSLRFHPISVLACPILFLYTTPSQCRSVLYVGSSVQDLTNHKKCSIGNDLVNHTTLCHDYYTNSDLPLEVLLIHFNQDLVDKI